MKKPYTFLGKLFVVMAVIFFFVYSLVVVKSPDEQFARDILGLAIPTPPVWTSFIPYIGFWLGVIFEFFSLHGLVGIGVLAVFGGIASSLFAKGIRGNGEKPRYE